jgi:hypothetical protein
LQEKPLISECKINAGVEVNGVKTATNENKYLTLAELAENEINKTIKNQNLPIEKGINLWTLAKSGIIGINKVFGSKIILNNTKDTTTNRTRFELDTGLLGYYSSSEKK